MQIARLGPLQTGSPRPPDWHRDRDRMLAYLRAGRVIRAARSLTPDELDPDRTPAVPITVLTDGEWVWTGAVIYYAEQHDIPVDPALLSHARAREFVLGEMSPAAVAAAVAALDTTTPSDRG